MKKINFLKLIVVCLLIAGCLPAITKEGKPSSFGYGSKIPVIGVFDDYNEIFRGYYIDYGVGNSEIEMRGHITGMKCQGYSYPTFIPKYSPNCEGLEGKAHLTCDDGRKIDCIWKATACFMGVGKGIDQSGNKLTFVYGMTESTATRYIDLDYAARIAVNQANYVI